MESYWCGSPPSPAAPRKARSDREVNAEFFLINLIDQLPRYEHIVPLKLLPRNAVLKARHKTRNDQKAINHEP